MLTPREFMLRLKKVVPIKDAKTGDVVKFNRRFIDMIEPIVGANNRWKDSEYLSIIISIKGEFIELDSINVPMHTMWFE